MKFLELRIPPVLLIVIFMSLMLVCSIATPNIGLNWTLKGGLFTIFLVFSATIALSGVLQFKKHCTTVNPISPDKTSKLVTSGIYTLTRNPMYVGFSIYLIGFSFLLDNLPSLILVFVYVQYMTLFQIIPEERFLSAIFKEEFDEYSKKTRRWL